MARGRPRKNPEDVLIRSAELIGWALGGIEREIMETRNRLAALTAQAATLRKRIGRKGPQRPLEASTPAPEPSEPETDAPATQKSGTRRRRRKMSPEARKRLSDMMKKRWAEKKKA